MLRIRLAAILLLLAGAGIAWFVAHSDNEGARFPFRYGLDLAGGTHLVYQADVSKIDPTEVSSAMQSLRDVIERRVNVFGVSEPLVQTERGGLTGSGEERLIVELPGITNLSDAVSAIGSTPVLDFRLVETAADGTATYVPTGLTGAYLSHASLEFSSGRAGSLSNEPIIGLQFNSEGAQRFADITGKNTGKQLGIFLDNQLISSPVIQEVIPNGQATITGTFTPTEAAELVRNLNFGALPVPISLESSQSVGASLGAQALSESVRAGMWGFLLLALFLLVWYRLPGIIAIVALIIYVGLSLAIFKLIPVTLTEAGLAGFILSIGMAVDANILIFERTKEELRAGKPLQEAIHEGFHRAWTSIRDSNFSSILTGIILYFMGGTAIIKGFALVFVIGVLVSMFTAVTLTRTFLISLGFGGRASKLAHFLFGAGFTK